MKKTEVLKEMVFLLVIFLNTCFVSFYKLNQFPQDFDAEQTNEPGSGMIVLSQAREKNISAEKAIDQTYEKWKRPIEKKGAYLEMMSFSLPFSGALFYTFFKLTNSPFNSILFINVFVGFLIVLATYLLARALYKKEVALLATFMFSGSLFFLLFTRVGKIYFGLTTFFSALLLFFFFLACKRQSRRYLFFTGIIGALAWFNGWSPVFLLPFILGSFLFLNRKKKFFLLSQYFKVLAVTFGVFLVLSLVYCWFFKADFYQVLYWIHRHWLFARGEAEGQSLASLLDRFINFKIFFQTMFLGLSWREASFLSHIYQVLPQRPFIPFFLSPFFFVGIFALFFRKNLADKLCLLTLVIPFLLFSFFFKFQPRYLFFISPVIYIVIAVGVTKVFQKIPKIFKKETVVLVLRSAVVLGIVFSLYLSYKDYFVFYIKNDGFMTRFHGLKEATEFVMAQGKPENSQIVLGDQVLVAYDTFFFYTQGQPYSVKYWTEFGFLEGGQVATAEEVEKWEEEILKEKEKIFYVFPLGPHFYFFPGPVLWYPAMGLGAFEELHPDLAPSKTIYYTSGIPALTIYEVNRNTPHYQRFNLLSLKDRAKILSLNQEIAAVYGSGSLIDYFDFLPKSAAPKIVLLTFGQKSLIRFYPTFRPGKELNDFYFSNNLILSQLNGYYFLSLSQEDEGFLVYKISLPTKIKEVTTQTNPQIFNDEYHFNSFAIDYSLDNTFYKNLFILDSNKNRHWTGINDRQTYHRLKVESPTFYLKLIFRGRQGEVQFWPNPVYPLLEVTFDSSDFFKSALEKLIKSEKLAMESNDKVILYIKRK